MIELAKRLKLARENKGVTQTQVYKDIGIHNKTLSGYERGISEPDLNTIKTLANYYNVSVDYLLGLTESEVLENPMNIFSKRLKHLRQLNNITQQELADYLKVGKTTISNYETKYSSPDAETLYKIADFFDTSVDYLLGRTEQCNLDSDDSVLENPTLQEIEGLSEESKKELEQYIRLLKIKDEVDKNKEEQSSTSEKDA